MPRSTNSKADSPSCYRRSDAPRSAFLALRITPGTRPKVSAGLDGDRDFRTGIPERQLDTSVVLLPPCRAT
jgi:hypothetical protein